MFYLPWKFFSMIKTRGAVRTQSTMLTKYLRYRGGSRTTATSKIECFVIIVNGWKPLTIITKHSILDVAAALDPPLR